MTWAPLIGSLLLRPERAPVADDERALLDGVIAAPDADGPRLVYADWLQHHGDVARGELIAVQCALATIAEPVEHNRLKARDFELVERHGNRWCAEVGIGEVRNNWHRHDWAADFQRGFIEIAQMPAAAFPSVVTQLFSVEPVREVVLVGYHDNRLRRLHESIYLRRLRSLVLRKTGLDTDVIVSIITSPMLAGLERIALERQPVDSRTITVLASMRYRALALPGANLYPGQLSELLAGPVCAHLEELVLDDNPFGVDGVLILAYSKGLPRLRKLSLRGVHVDVSVLGPLVARFGAALHM